MASENKTDEEQWLGKRCLQCDNPVTEQYELGRAIGVTGTPALLTKAGTLIPGYMPPEQLKQRLEELDAQLAQAP